MFSTSCNLNTNIVKNDNNLQKSPKEEETKIIVNSFHTIIDLFEDCTKYRFPGKFECDFLVTEHYNLQFYEPTSYFKRLISSSSTYFSEISDLKITSNFVSEGNSSVTNVNIDGKPMKAIVWKFPHSFVGTQDLKLSFRVLGGIGSNKPNFDIDNPSAPRNYLQWETINRESWFADSPSVKINQYSLAIRIPKRLDKLQKELIHCDPQPSAVFHNDSKTELVFESKDMMQFLAKNAKADENRKNTMMEIPAQPMQIHILIPQLFENCGIIPYFTIVAWFIVGVPLGIATFTCLMMSLYFLLKIFQKRWAFVAKMQTIKHTIFNHLVKRRKVEEEFNLKNNSVNLYFYDEVLRRASNNFTAERES